MPGEAIWRHRMHENPSAACDPPQIQLWIELTALPRIIVGGEGRLSAPSREPFGPRLSYMPPQCHPTWFGLTMLCRYVTSHAPMQANRAFHPYGVGK